MTAIVGRHMAAVKRQCPRRDSRVAFIVCDHGPMPGRMSAHCPHMDLPRRAAQGFGPDGDPAVTPRATGPRSQDGLRTRSTGGTSPVRAAHYAASAFTCCTVPTPTPSFRAIGHILELLVSESGRFRQGPATIGGATVAGGASVLRSSCWPRSWRRSPCARTLVARATKVVK
jgi:hypothetical protein